MQVFQHQEDIAKPKLWLYWPDRRELLRQVRESFFTEKQPCSMHDHDVGNGLQRQQAHWELGKWQASTAGRYASPAMVLNLMPPVRDPCSLPRKFSLTAQSQQQALHL